ncbi:MAG TPA: hypothetical protein PK156_34255, partial [Polyangium sp.]|nr:hypothetical protein [Polyangium sp.]
MKSAHARTWQYLLIGSILIAGGCGLTNDMPDAGPAANTSEKDSTADTPHLGPGSIRCSRCHSDETRQDVRWKEIAKKVGHDIDTSLASRTTCTCCHIGEVKGFGEPIDRQCVECHDEIHVTITGMGRLHCLSCHDPSSVGGALIRESAWECQKCHGQTQGKRQAIDVHSAEDCTNCHHPHEEPWTLPRNCTDCHIANETHHGENEGASPCNVMWNCPTKEAGQEHFDRWY